MYKIRPYQQELLNKYYQICSEEKSRPLIQAPTGSGKSIIMQEILSSVVDKEKPVLLVAHKEELINQLVEHFIRRFGKNPTIIADSSRYTYDAENPFCVASIQGWASRLKQEKPLPVKPSIVLIDEAHHVCSPLYSKFIDFYKESHIVGLTATPYRIDGRGFKYLDNGVKGFDVLIKGPAVLDLIKQGYLSEVKIFGATKTIGSDFKVVMGEFSQKQQAEAIKVQIKPDEVVEEWQRLANGKKTILYPISVEISKEYCEAFNSFGIPAAHIDSNTPSKQRKAILDNFKHGNILVLCQHSIVIEGVDVPDVECVQFVRATNSLNLWWQAIGRGMRPHPNKPHLIVIDHSNNHERLPLITTPIEFFLDPKPVDDDFGVTICPYCDHTFTKNSTDQSKFKEVKELSELEIAKFSFQHDLSNTEEKATVGTKFLKGFFIDLNCPNCNQVFSHAKYEEKKEIIVTSTNNNYLQELDNRLDEIADDDGDIEEIKPRNKEEIFYKIKEICQRPLLSKTMKLVHLDFEVGIKNLDDEEIKLFINDCQAKTGWFYYIKNGQAMQTDYFQKCRQLYIKEMIDKEYKQKEKVKKVFDLMLEKN